MIPVDEIRKDFPALSRVINRRPLVYLDNTATSQTPRQVVDALADGYFNRKANVHRGIHTLSQEATESLEATRRAVADRLNVASPDQIIFTRGTTEALNLVAASFGSSILKPGDEIILSVMEHHANIVPWQLLRERIPFDIKVVDIRPDGSLDIQQLESLLSERTRIVSLCHASNVLGTVNPVKEISRMVHAHGAYLVVDGAQASPHLKIDISEIDPDFYCFSAHKMYGPTGVGVLYGRRSLLENMPPYQGGGEMIANVTFEKTTFAELPYKFEAGTPDFVGIAAFRAALEWIDSVGIEDIEAHEHSLLDYTTQRLREELPDIRIYGSAPGKCAIISFNLPGAHHYDVALLLDKQGVAVRSGHHCAQPLMHRLGIEGCVRASFAAYNTREEADRFVGSLIRASQMLV